MPHVSKQVLKKVTTTQLGRQLIQLFSSLEEKQTRIVLTELLTLTERIMLAKRIALIYMLKEGHSYYHIQKTLGISTSTTARYDEQIQAGMYSELIFPSKKRSQSKKMFELLVDGLEIARMGMPTRSGPRWTCPDRLKR